MTARPDQGVLAIDLGTSSVKTLVLDQHGQVIGRGQASYPTLHPHPSHDEQYLDDWLQAAISAAGSAQRFAPHLDVRAVAVTGQMHGTVLFDRAGQSIGPAIIWSDRRASGDIDALAAAFGRDLAERIGGPLAAGYQSATLAWLRVHRPVEWSRIGKILLPKDALVYLLTGIAATDPSDAVGTGLLDAGTGHWDSAILDRLGIEPEWLPPIMPSGTPIVPLTVAVAEAMQLRPGIPVVVAGGDAPVAAIGAGVTDSDAALVVLSTGAQVIRPAVEYRPDPAGRWHTWPSAIPAGATGARWNQIGATLNAGRALNWIHRLVAADTTMSELLDRAANVPPAADGLLFIPYLIGERCPLNDPHARGAFIGLSEAHGPEQMIRAVVEGVTLAIADTLDYLSGNRPLPGTIRLGGGGAASPVWRQIVADVLNAQIRVSSVADLSALGAARIAAHTLGWAPISGTQTRKPDHARMISPHPDQAARYHELLTVYRQAAATLVPLTHALRDLSK